MNGFSSRGRATVLAGLAASTSALVLSGCPSQDAASIAKDPQKYAQVVSAFHSGVVALSANDPKRAEDQLIAASRLAPKEPAIWANLGLHYLRGQRYEPAAEALKQARTLAPNDSRILVISALLENAQGKSEPAVEYLRAALKSDPANVEAHGLLIEQLERLSAPGWEQEVERHYAQVLQVQPGNVSAQLALARMAAKAGARDLLAQRLEALTRMSAGWPQDALDRLAALRKSVASSSPPVLAANVQKLANVLRPTSQYRVSQIALGGDTTRIGAPLQYFLRLPQPTAAPAPRDESLTFEAEEVGAGKATWAAAYLLAPAPPPTPDAPAPSAATEKETAALVSSQGGKLILGTAGETALSSPGNLGSPQAVLPIDWNDDYRPDLIVVGSGGVRFFQQGAKGQWTDVTARTGLRAAVTGAAFGGAWAADLDLDGDLDAVAAPPHGAPVGLRNNGDGTWTVIRPFTGVSGLREWAWADLDGDGDPDAALIDGKGELVVLLNERGGQYRKAELTASGGTVRALSVADADHEGTLDLVVLRSGGAIQAISTPDGKQWKSVDLARWSEAPSTGSVRLMWGDLDNNGGLDLVAASAGSTQIWLQDEQRTLQLLNTPRDVQVFSLDDQNGDARLDLVGVTSAGRPVRLLNRGTKNYHWQVIRPRNVTVKSGDNKINAFGVGGEAEVRAGLLVQKQPITGPRVHFGLGDYAESDVVRITWPNGQVQGEFELAANAAPLAIQRLTGSCPWLFAHDGKSVKFVTDVLWKSPLGLRINAQNTAGVSQTRDWVRVRGDQLAPVNGYYDLRVTAELWETDFFDYTSLLVVDHPAGTEVLVDERFSIPQPPLEVLVAQPPVPVKRAVDQDGADVTETVARLDEQYLDTFKLGQYQGVAQDHFVEVELPDGVGPDGRVWLLGYGWIFPTDSSINVAISQGRHAPPQGLSLEVPDGKGGWKTVRKGLGFPAGKYKTVRLDLTGLFPAGTPGPRKVRLRTNMEIYWDRLAVTTPVPAGDGGKVPRLQTREILPETAELRYRGFSALRHPRRSYPETPEYDRLAGTAPIWFDLVGHYTRFGDVRELLTKVDDRYVIMNAGDELRLRFPAVPAPTAGWTRDYIFVSDGWDKDGNFNTSYSTTLLPLPSHDRPDYNTPPTPLEADPVYRRFPQDWVKYHTRYISTEPFRKALRP